MPTVDSGVVAVTGANGFIGAHVVLALLDAGYTVRACVRDATDDAKTKFLIDLAAAHNASDRLSFYSCDLLKSHSFDAAFAGADAVVHTAAAVELFGAGDEQRRVVDPSVEGVKNVLSSVKASNSGWFRTFFSRPQSLKNESVRRLVHTSSIAAIFRVNEPAFHTFTEEDWNTYSSIANGDAYGYAKRLAEETMWKETRAQKRFDAVALNPSVVLGECLTKQHTKGSTIFVRQALYNAKAVSFAANFVDVKDVAAAHVEALRRADATNRRFILTCDHAPMFTHEIGEVAARLFPQYQISLSQAVHPALWWALSWLSVVPVVGGYVLKPAQRQSAEKIFYFKNDAAKQALGVEFRDVDTMVKETVTSMVDKGFIKAKAKL